MEWTEEEKIAMNHKHFDTKNLVCPFCFGEIGDFSFWKAKGQYWFNCWVCDIDVCINHANSKEDAIQQFKRHLTR